MVDIPALCTRCGLIFPSGFAVSGSAKAWIVDSKSQCPRCRNLADIADGAYEAAGDALRLIEGSALAESVLSAFNQLLLSARRGEISTDALEVEADKLSSSLGNSVRAARAKTPFTMVVAALLIAVLQRCEFKLDAKLDINRALDQVLELTDTASHRKDAAENKEPSNGTGGDSRYQKDGRNGGHDDFLDI